MNINSQVAAQDVFDAVATGRAIAQTQNGNWTPITDARTVGFVLYVRASFGWFIPQQWKVR